MAVAMSEGTMGIVQINLRPLADVVRLQHSVSFRRSGVTTLAPASLDAKQTEALGTFLALRCDSLSGCSVAVLTIPNTEVSLWGGQTTWKWRMKSAINTNNDAVKTHFPRSTPKARN